MNAATTLKTFSLSPSNIEAVILSHDLIVLESQKAPCAGARLLNVLLNFKRPQMLEFKIIFPTGYKILDINSDNIDINVVLPNGEVYFGTLFTNTNIKYLMNQERQHYFWATDMIIIEDLSKETIYKAIEELIESNYLSQALTKIGIIETVYQGCITYESLPVNWWGL
jgi:hypothetical protein